MIFICDAITLLKRTRKRKTTSVVMCIVCLFVFYVDRVSYSKGGGKFLPTLNPTPLPLHFRPNLLLHSTTSQKPPEDTSESPNFKEGAYFKTPVGAACLESSIVSPSGQPPCINLWLSEAFPTYKSFNPSVYTYQ